MYTRTEVLDRHPSEMAKLSQAAYNKMAREHSLAGTCRYCGAELTKFFMFRYKMGMYYCNYECRSYELAAKGLRNMRLEAEEIARETKAATKAAGALKAGACSECGTAIRVGEYEGPQYCSTECGYANGRGGGLLGTAHKTFVPNTDINYIKRCSLVPEAEVIRVANYKIDNVYRREARYELQRRGFTLVGDFYGRSIQIVKNS